LTSSLAQRAWSPLLLAGLIALFAAVAAQGAWRPYLFDEANFLFQARATADTGIPYANMGYMGDRGRVTSREQYGLWHPPLYAYLLGLNVKLFDGDERAVRGMGIGIMALTALAVYGLGRTITGAGGRGSAAGLLAAALFVAGPLVVQSATIVDIDGTLLLLAMTTWALLFLRWETTTDPRRLAALGVLLAIALWAKATTPLALIGVVLVYQALAGRLPLGLRQAAIIILVGFPLFLGSWWLVAAALHLPFEMPFQWTAWELLDASKYTRSWLGDLSRMRGELAPPLVWTSPYLIAAFGALALGRGASWLRTRRAEPVDFLILLGGLIFAAYFIKLAANFPKYHVGMMPFWSAALAWWVVDWVCASRWWERLLYLVNFGAAALYFQSAVRDNWMWTNALVWDVSVLGPALVLFVLAAAAAVVPAWRPISARLVALLLLSYLGWAVPVDAAQARADYSTSYYYGTRGQRQAAALLNALHYDGPWVGPKEVAWYARNKQYIDADTFWWLVLADGLRFDGKVLGYDVAVVLPWTMDPEVRNFFWDQLERRYDPIAEVEDYTAWVRHDYPRPRLSLDSAPTSQ